MATTPAELAQRAEKALRRLALTRAPADLADVVKALEDFRAHPTMTFRPVMLSMARDHIAELKEGPSAARIETIADVWKAISEEV